MRSIQLTVPEQINILRKEFYPEFRSSEIKTLEGNEANNTIIIGPPGVGKTQTVNYLTPFFFKNDIKKTLVDCRGLTITGLLACIQASLLLINSKNEKLNKRVHMNDFSIFLQQYIDSVEGVFKFKLILDSVDALIGEQQFHDLMYLLSRQNRYDEKVIEMSTILIMNDYGFTKKTRMIEDLKKKIDTFRPEVIMFNNYMIGDVKTIFKKKLTSMGIPESNKVASLLSKEINERGENIRFGISIIENLLKKEGNIGENIGDLTGIPSQPLRYLYETTKESNNLKICLLLLLDIFMERGVDLGITFRELYQIYLTKFVNLNVFRDKPYSMASMHEALKIFIEFGLIEYSECTSYNTLSMKWDPNDLERLYKKLMKSEDLLEPNGKYQQKLIF